jgi:hypothetical protein
MTISDDRKYIREVRHIIDANGLNNLMIRFERRAPQGYINMTPKEREESKMVNVPLGKLRGRNSRFYYQYLTPEQMVNLDESHTRLQTSLEERTLYSRMAASKTEEDGDKTFDEEKRYSLRGFARFLWDYATSPNEMVKPEQPEAQQVVKIKDVMGKIKSLDGWRGNRVDGVSVELIIDNDLFGESVVLPGKIGFTEEGIPYLHFDTLKDIE